MGNTRESARSLTSLLCLGIFVLAAVAGIALWILGEKRQRIPLWLGIEKEARIPSPALEVALRAKLDIPEGPIPLARIGELTSLDILRSRKEESTRGAPFTDLRGIDLCTGLRNLRVLVTGQADLVPMGRLPALEELRIACREPRDIQALSELTGLRKLDLNGCRLSDAAPLGKLVHLEELNLHGCGLQDLEPLAHLESLRKLVLSGFPIASITPLRDLTRLEQLSLRGTLEIADLGPLEKLVQLTDLDLGQSGVRDLAPLAGLTALEKLVLDSNAIEDLAPLEGLTALRELTLDGNRIQDLKPLEKLTALEWLSLRGNPAPSKAIRELRRALPEVKITR